MKLRDMIALQANSEYLQVMPGITPVPTFHPPSLKNPKHVPQELPTDGWHQGDAKEARAKAINDMLEILRRTRRQGKPEVFQQALVDPYGLWRRW